MFGRTNIFLLKKNHILAFFWGNSVFLLECTVEAGVVPKAKLMAKLGNSSPAFDCFFTGLKTLLSNITIDGYAIEFFEYMGDMKFADKKLLGQLLQREIIFQMVLDIINHIFM